MGLDWVFGIYLDRLDRIIINAMGIHHNFYLSPRNSLRKLPRKCEKNGACSGNLRNEFLEDK